VRACPFDALSRDGRNTPVVDLQKCTGCGNCVKECPKSLIILMPLTSRPHIACNTCEKGKTVREICQIGCITCGKCVKVCPEKAIEMVDNRPLIDYEKCTNCGTCIENCPRKIIRDMIPTQQIKAAVQ
jgi:ferredoxin